MLPSFFGKSIIFKTAMYNSLWSWVLRSYNRSRSDILQNDSQNSRRTRLEDSVELNLQNPTNANWIEFKDSESTKNMMRNKEPISGHQAPSDSIIRTLTYDISWDLLQRKVWGFGRLLLMSSLQPRSQDSFLSLIRWNLELGKRAEFSWDR